MISAKLESEHADEAIGFDGGGFRRRGSAEPIPESASRRTGAEEGSRCRVPLQAEHFLLKADLKVSPVRHAHVDRLSALYDPEAEDVVLAYLDVVSALK